MAGSYLDRALDDTKSGDTRRRVLRFMKETTTGGLKSWAGAEFQDLESAREKRICPPAAATSIAPPSHDGDYRPSSNSNCRCGTRKAVVSVSA